MKPKRDNHRCWRVFLSHDDDKRLCSCMDIKEIILPSSFSSWMTCINIHTKTDRNNNKMQKNSVNEDDLTRPW